MSDQTQSEKFKTEVKALLYRWTEESDLDDLGLAESLLGAVNEWLGEDVIYFEADEDVEPG